MMVIKNLNDLKLYLVSKKIDYKKFTYEDNPDRTVEFQNNPNFWHNIFKEYDKHKPVITYLFDGMSDNISPLIVGSAIFAGLPSNITIRLIKMADKNSMTKNNIHLDFEATIFDAVSANNPELLSALLKYLDDNKDIEPKNGSWGNACDGTTLTESAKIGNIKITRMLLDHGASVLLDDHWSFVLAMKHAWYNIARLLMDHGADIHIRNDLGLKMMMRNDKMGVLPMGEQKISYTILREAYSKKED